MEASQLIRAAVAQVESLRKLTSSQREVSEALSSVKQFQSRRFEFTYRDLLHGGPYQTAANFFLVELYGDSDYSGRDAQFARIAGAIERLLPRPAIATAVAMAELHALTEQLDYDMARAWQQIDGAGKTVDSRYVDAWRYTDRREERSRQLRLVLQIGSDLDKLTKTRGLRLLLKMMRGPAHAAGLQDLQRFLEVGFDTFAAMGKDKAMTPAFLALIESRETLLMRKLFDVDMAGSNLILTD